MLSLLKNFPEQIKEAIEIGKKISLDASNIQNVVISGMGGSGIVGDILKHVAKIPFFVNKDYSIPSFVSSKTLFVAISYSGNTEETIESYKKAKRKGAKTIIITSDGWLGKRKNAILIPPGMQPRAAIAYLLFPISVFLERNGIIKKIDYGDVINVAETMRNRMNIAKEVANEINGIPIIYGHGILEAIAKRWRQQFNENAKMHAFSFGVSESNHNEIEAWENDGNNFTCIFLRNSKEREEIKKRFEFMEEVYGKNTRVIQIFGEGKNDFSAAIYLLYFGDLTSVYKAMERGVEPEPVNLIMQLKRRLSTQDPHH